MPWLLLAHRFRSRQKYRCNSCGFLVKIQPAAVQTLNGVGGLVAVALWTKKLPGHESTEWRFRITFCSSYRKSRAVARPRRRRMQVPEVAVLSQEAKTPNLSPATEPYDFLRRLVVVGMVTDFQQ
jgi:hypothetical protein